MKITLNKKEYDITFGFKSMIIYEKITKKTFVPDGLESIVIYLYSCILASDNSFSVDFDTFCKWLDEDPSVLTKFTDGLIESTNTRTEIINTNDDEVKEGEDLSKND